jgi:glucose-1-phosphate cytidylyltransferase
MKVVIFAGGRGTRISEESSLRPKPMIEIGGKPILWHIMKIYAAYGHTEFIICLGYKGWQIKEYFTNYFMHNTDVTVDLSNNSIQVHNNYAEPFKIPVLIL